MNRTDRLYFLTVILAGFFVMSLPVLAGKSYGAENKDPVWEALTGGKVSLNVRYRYEWVDMESLSKEAHASTVRTRLGYQTGEVSGFSGLVEFEDVTVVGSERYNNTKNGKTEYPVVADPEDTEVNQAYLAYRGLKDTVIKVGRQKIFLDNARFIGNVGWRQNEQTFDAVLVQNRSVPDLTGTYAYLSNVNRVFGGHHPTMANFRVGSHLVNVAYTGFKPASATVYGYFIDFDDVPSSSDPSTKTLGGQLKGSVALSEGFSLLYFAELADQTNHAGGLETNDARYMHFYAGAGIRNTFTVKMGFEKLAGDGTFGFQTPLGTLHAFQGWADQFAPGTPADGIKDLYLLAKAAFRGFQGVVVFHDFSSDKGGYDYGTELDLLVKKVFSKKYLIGAKYAHYRADTHSNNTTGLPALDTDKFWIFTGFSF